MKSFVVFGLCIIAAVSVNARKGGGKADPFGTCARELGYTPEAVKDMIDKSDSKIGCIVACVLKKEGILVNNEIKDDVAYTKLKAKSSSKNLKDNAKTCADTANKETEECSKAGEFAKCIFPYIKSGLKPADE